jgi:hypothetical protein
VGAFETTAISTATAVPDDAVMRDGNEKCGEIAIMKRDAIAEQRCHMSRSLKDM